MVTENRQTEISQRNTTLSKGTEIVDEQIVEDECSDVEKDKPPKKSLVARGLGLMKRQASIDYYSYDFEKLIKGKRADMLTKYLASLSHSSPLFENQTIQAYIETQWSYLRMNYMKIIILYFVSIVIMLPYFDPEYYSINDALEEQDWTYVITFLTLQLGISFYLLVFEWRNLMRFKNILTIQFLALIYNIEQCLLPVLDIMLFLITHYNKDEEL